MSETLTDTFSLHNDGNGNSNCSTAQMQEFNDVREFLKIYYNKYTKYKILHEAVEDTLADGTGLDLELKLKVQNVLLQHNCAQVMELDSEDFGGQGSDTLLGLTATDLTKSVLSYNESLELKKAVVAAMERKYDNICESFSKVFGKNVNTVPTSDAFGDLNMNASDRGLFELKKKVQDQQRKYLENLSQEHKLLERMANLRLEKLPKVCENKVIECQTKCQIATLRSKMVQEKTRVDIFTGTSNSLSAYKELMKDIKEQQEECQRDIQYLEQLKKKYAQVACKQYDDLLKSYIQYKSSLEKKKMLYDSLYCQSQR